MVFVYVCASYASRTVVRENAQRGARKDTAMTTLAQTSTPPASSTQRRVRGEEHPTSVYTEAQVAQAKRLLADAPRAAVLARGQLREISRKTGIPRASLLHIHNGVTWKHVDPAPATVEEEPQ